MFSLFKKKQPNKLESENSTPIQWEKSARDALNQAVAQAPVPAIMKQQAKRQLEKAAEEYALSQGKITVSAEDLMHGLMARLPEGMRKKVEDAAKKEMG